MLLLSILHSCMYKYVLCDIVALRNSASVSSVTHGAPVSRVCIYLYYTYKYILDLLFVFLERKLLLFIIYLLFLYQTMIKYNNVNILVKG